MANTTPAQSERVSTASADERAKSDAYPTNKVQDRKAEEKRRTEQEDGEVTNAPEPKSDEVQFFDTTIAKVKKDKDGNEYVVMSDHLDPGERLKRDVDAEKAEKRAKRDKDAADKAAEKASK